MPFGNQELTDTGVSYLTQAQLGDELRVRRMVVGSGVAANLPDDLWPLTALIAYEIDVPITSSEYVTPDTLKVVGLLDSTQIPSGGGFDLNEIGLMVECGTLPEALYSVDNTGGGGDQIPDRDSTSPVIQQLELYIKIARVDNISINVQPAGTYDAVNRGLATLGPGPYIEKVGDVLHFKRFVAGDGIEILDDALTPPETIVIGIKKLKVDLDTYVANGNPDVFPNFSTIQKAHDYLLDFYIPSNTYARINVAGEVFDSSASININHPQGKQIQIIGELGNVHNILTSGVSGGAAGAVTIPLNVDAGLGMDIAVGDLVLVDVSTMVGVTDYLQVSLNNCLEVVNVAGTVVTVLVPHSLMLPDLNIVSFGTMTKLRTVINQLANVDVILIAIGGLGLLNNIGIKGNASRSIVVNTPNSVTFDTVGITNAQGGGVGHGIVAYTGSHTGIRVKIASCRYGFASEGNVNLNLSDCQAHFCSGYGFSASSGSSHQLNNCIAFNNALIGMQSAYGSLILLSGVTQSLFSPEGIQASFDSSVTVTYLGSAIILQNTLDLNVGGWGLIMRGSGTQLAYLTASQAIDTVLPAGIIAP